MFDLIDLRTTSAIALGALSLTFASAAEARVESETAGTRSAVWAPADMNFSRWSSLDPASNQRRAELLALEAKLEDFDADDVGSIEARARAHRAARDAHRALEQLAKAEWSRRGALEAKVAAAVFMLGRQLDAITPAPQPSAQISGPVHFPGCSAPDDLLVCAAPVGAPAPSAVETCVAPSAAEGELRYVLPVHPGEYVVYAKSASVQPGFHAYYSRAVECGLSVDCTDHRPVILRIEAGQAVGQIAPADWSAPVALASPSRS